MEERITIIAYNQGCKDNYIQKEAPFGFRFFTPSELVQIIRLAANQLDAYQEVGLTTDAEIEKINAAEDERFVEWLVDIQGRGAK